MGERRGEAKGLAGEIGWSRDFECDDTHPTASSPPEGGLIPLAFAGEAVFQNLLLNVAPEEESQLIPHHLAHY